jgi:predicted DNA-binding transcriptional regulator YafY
VLRLDYRDQDGRSSLRDVEPLCLAFWGGAWTLGAWCRLRVDFRSFRPDRIASFDAVERDGVAETFDETPARGLEAYLRAVGAQALPD